MRIYWCQLKVFHYICCFTIINLKRMLEINLARKVKVIWINIITVVWRVLVNCWQIKFLVKTKFYLLPQWFYRKQWLGRRVCRTYCKFNSGGTSTPYVVKIFPSSWSCCFPWLLKIKTSYNATKLIKKQISYDHLSKQRSVKRKYFSF